MKIVESINSNAIASSDSIQHFEDNAFPITMSSKNAVVVSKPINHKKLLDRLKEQIVKIDFVQYGEMEDSVKLTKKHYLICCIHKILEIADTNNWGICRNHDFIYLYNGAYWDIFDKCDFESFLGESAEIMGVDKFDARHYSFRESLFKQFLATANLNKPDNTGGKVRINLKNGTFEISPNERVLRPFDKGDFLKYQLPFDFDSLADAPLFMSYLNRVLPDTNLQKILAEYLGYVFIKTSTLKLEKALILYGGGSNGKSVFFDVISALLGDKNISSYSLRSLTDDKGYQRAKLEGMLLNYGSDISVDMDSAIFKQLVSGETTEARLPYGEPFQLTDYAKLIFNCNTLPLVKDKTNGFFRRFLIIPFEVTIPDNEQDKELARKIIRTELSGVFNWVLEGLERLLIQRNFTKSEIVVKQVESYKRDSDTVLSFLEDENLTPSTTSVKPLKTIYGSYRSYCNESGYNHVCLKEFSKNIQRVGFKTERKNYGQAVFVEKKVIQNATPPTPTTPNSVDGVGGVGEIKQ